jgi:hypothetical protein
MVCPLPLYRLSVQISWRPSYVEGVLGLALLWRLGEWHFNSEPLPEVLTVFAKELVPDRRHGPLERSKSFNSVVIQLAPRPSSH